MIHINFAEPTLQAWRHWRTQCDSEQGVYNDAIESGAKPNVKDAVYKGQKHVYLHQDGPFHGKCAYCEERIFSDQHGDIDHFRPKAEVVDHVTGSKVRVQKDGSEVTHPGYYWLAYDWRNLLPSCVLCNRGSSSHSSTPFGKRSYFPVAGYRAIRPGEEACERPLLIHPVLDDPGEDLEVDETGVLSARNGSVRGKTCIRILGLNERGLPDRRRKRYTEVRDKIALRILAIMEGRDSDALGRIRGLFEQVAEGDEEFCAVARRAIADCKR